MKKSSKKGFTLVELVIVIAVIAILAAVLIPTFANVQENAKQSASMQAARNEYDQYVVEKAKELTGKEDFVIASTDGYYFIVDNGQFSEKAYKSEDAAKSAAGITTGTATDVSKYNVYTKASVTVGTTVVTGMYTLSGETYTKVETADTKAAADTDYYTAAEKDFGQASVAIYQYK